MADNELQRTLKELHEELAQVRQVDPDLQKLLEDLRGDIEVVLERSNPEGLGDQLRDAVERFEASHPRLASAMGAVLDQLARLGI